MAPLLRASGEGPGETHLIQALAKVLAEAPSGGWGGIIILTDGNETSPHTQGMTALVHNAQAAGTPLYFIPGYADTVEKVMETRPFATWNNLVVPAQIKPQSTFTVELTVDSFQSVPKSLPVKVRMGDEWRPGPPIFLNAGRRVSQWQMELKAEMPGVFPLEIVAGEPPDELRAITQIQVKSLRATTRLLYFDSSIDWGGRMIRDVLGKDTKYESLATVAMSSEWSAILRNGARPKKVSEIQLPQTTAGFIALDVVIVANTSAARLSNASQAALIEWIRTGGHLLLIASQTEMLSSYAQTLLGNILPLDFAKPKIAVRNPVAKTPLESVIPELAPFVWTSEGSEIFKIGNAIPVPKLQFWASAGKPKPAAHVLATHPSEKTEGTGDFAVLLAWQRYGAGLVMQMNTDTLWSWKLSLPHQDHNPEIFWQQIFSWLSRKEERLLRFDHPPVYADVAKPIKLRVVGKNTFLESASGACETSSPIALKHTNVAQTNESYIDWTPAKPGLWQIRAADIYGQQIIHWITVRPPSEVPAPVPAPTGENSGQPTNEEFLRSLAASTGGELLLNHAPGVWAGVAKERTDLVSEQRTALWHRPMLFVLLIGLYAIDLLLRRLLRLF